MTGCDGDNSTRKLPRESKTSDENQNEKSGIDGGSEAHDNASVISEIERQQLLKSLRALRRSGGKKGRKEGKEEAASFSTVPLLLTANPILQRCHGLQSISIVPGTKILALGQGIKESIHDGKSISIVPRQPATKNSCSSDNCSSYRAQQQ